MEWYPSLKTIHILTIHISISLFVVRFIMKEQGANFWSKRPYKYVPHLNDTILLTSAILLLVVTGWQLFVHVWITVKSTLVLCYIVMGFFAMSSKLPPILRKISALLAVLIFALIYFLALTKPS